MHYKMATAAAHTLLKAAMDDVEKMIEKSPQLNIQHPETLIAAYLKSATQIYLHEQLQKEHE